MELLQHADSPRSLLQQWVRGGPERSAKHSGTRPLRKNQDIFDYFATTHSPFFWISLTISNVLGMEEWVRGFQCISAVDSFGSAYPHIFIPSQSLDYSAANFEDACFAMLQDEEVLSHIKTASAARKSTPKLLFLFFDARVERAAARSGLQVAMPPAALREYLDSKIVTTRLANEVGVHSAPNILTKVDSYASLLRDASEASLGTNLVVQLSHGDSGHTTFFISSAEEYLGHAAAIEAQTEVKVMKRIRCRQLTIEACITRHGVLVGPLMSELVGLAELTPFGGGWCGNEVFQADESTIVTPAIRLQAQQMAVRLGERLEREGLRGCFGIDLLLDQDSDTLYLGELNPRITGATPLTNLAAWSRGAVPLVLFHLLEWLGEPYHVDVEEYNSMWLHADELTGFSQLVIDALEPVRDVKTVPRSGIWKIGADGIPHFDHSEVTPRAIVDETEAFFLCTMNKGASPKKGGGMGRLILRGRVLTDEFALTDRAKLWIKTLRDSYHC